MDANLAHRTNRKSGCQLDLVELELGVSTNLDGLIMWSMILNWRTVAKWRSEWKRVLEKALAHPGLLCQ
ncbi:hypothetical protein TNCV_3807651 [Trichonephila clavipes]|nr:hypothetical protein TNCV_3807651 [Trichonephila clavipes]